MIIPEAAAGPGFHGIWPGLENDSEGFVYQNVVSDSNGPGLWEFFIEYCCKCVLPHRPHTQQKLNYHQPKCRIHGTYQ